MKGGSGVLDVLRARRASAQADLDQVEREVERMGARVEALIERCGKSVTGVSAALGWARTTLPRKLEGGGGRSGGRLTIEDLQEIVNHLGCAAGELMTPVLLPGDELLLSWIRDQVSPPNLLEALGFEAGAKRRIDRLVFEGFVRLDGHEDNPNLIPVGGTHG